jgi:hypothetical protein
MLYGHFIRGTRPAPVHLGKRINRRRTAVHPQHPQAAFNSSQMCEAWFSMHHICMRRTYSPICTLLSSAPSPRQAQYTRNTADLTSTTAPHASARYVSSLSYSRRCTSASARISYITPTRNCGSVTSAASPNTVPESAGTRVFGSARTPTATLVLWEWTESAPAVLAASRGCRAW